MKALAGKALSSFSEDETLLVKPSRFLDTIIEDFDFDLNFGNKSNTLSTGSGRICGPTSGASVILRRLERRFTLSGINKLPNRVRCCKTKFRDYIAWTFSTLGIVEVNNAHLIQEV